MPGDQRVSFLKDTLNCFYGSDVDAASIESVLASAEVSDFLNDTGSQLLRFTICEAELQVSNVLAHREKQRSEGRPSMRQIHFVKTRQEELTEENVREHVLVHAHGDSPVSTLYETLHNVYAPAILADPAASSKLDNTTQQLLTKLEKSLSYSLRSGSSRSVLANQAEDSLDAIREPIDEIHFWLETQARGGSEGDRAKVFSSYFKSIRDDFKNLSNLSLSEIEELVDETEVVLDEVWRANAAEVSVPYPQARMKHLMHAISNAFMMRIKAVLRKKQLFGDTFAEVRIAIQESIKVCEKWIRTMEGLVKNQWMNCDINPWKLVRDHLDETDEETYFSYPPLVEFLHRLDDILRIRTTNEELKSILSPSEQKQLQIGRTLDVFDGIELLHCNPYTQAEWDDAVLTYEKKILPVEKQIAAKLAGVFRETNKSGYKENPLTRLRQIERYQRLFCRPEITKLLSSELENLLADLIAYLEDLDTGSASSTREQDTSGSTNSSPAVVFIVKVKQKIQTVKALLNEGRKFFSELPAFLRFKNTAVSILENLESLAADEARKWRSDVDDQLQDGELSVELTGQLMEILDDGRFHVNYSFRLVQLLRDVRQLGQLGLSVPSKIKSAAKEAEKYYCYGVMLKQTANFYNTLETQIIPCQKHLLYDALVEFEQELKRPTQADPKSKSKGRVVTWADPEECKAYVERMRDAAERLGAENRRLRTMHSAICTEILRLMEIDMVKHKTKWKSVWSKIMKLMNEAEVRTVEGDRYEEIHLRKWKRHLDDQLYKALLVSYRMGLEGLNENLGEIKCELVFNNRATAFHPKMEELRSTYYKQMRKFITMPNAFKGLGNSRKFARMASSNSSSLVNVYNKAEDLFKRILEFKESMEGHAVIGKVCDLHEYVEAHCHSLSDWDVCIKVLKQKRRELDKVQDLYRIDCVVVNMTSFKSTVEDQLQQLNDALVMALRRRVTERLRGVEAKLVDWMKQLSQRPETIDEISEAKARWLEINSTKDNEKAVWTESEHEREFLLVLMTSMPNMDASDIVDLQARLPAKWEELEIALVAFNDMIADQMAELKQRVQANVQNCRRDVTSFASRWTALMPKDVTSWGEAHVVEILRKLDELHAQLDTVVEGCAAATKSCKYFEMEEPEFEGLDEIKREVDAATEEWKQLEEFNTELEAMKRTEWITFRTTIYDAEDLARKWLDKFKGKARGIVLDRIVEVCDGIRKAVPALKMMRGEPFKDEHWSALVRKLGMPKGTDLQSLTFGHFVDVLDCVADNLQFAKEMTARAQGEVTIRDAILELKSWSETAMVDLTTHSEMGRSTPLIKNWKDLFMELGDNQSLLASLKESQYFKPFEQQANVFEMNMAALNEYLTMMNTIQRRWVWLEPIFGRGALPAEQSRFRRVDEDWVEIMTTLDKDPLLFNLCDDAAFPRMQDTLKTMIDQLERCQKALVDFLEEKRNKLPRFYFIGDDDLLEILGQAKNPAVIQNHLKKLFQGIHRVQFNEAQSGIVAIQSSAGETVVLNTVVQLNDDVEDWLNALSEAMASTLKEKLVQCVYEKDQADLSAYPSQVLCLAENIKFTSKCEFAIEKDNVKSLKKLLKKTLQNYTNVDASEISQLEQLKIKALVLDLVHNIDVCNQLIHAKVSSTADWMWQKQLRYYINSDNECVARMCDSEIRYSYEYWGNAPKLVHTPLTDKCYLTLTQGMHMGFGGSPYGPAGTGKTESVKALGACFGRQVLVFNCDEGIDFQAMGRIFTGLVKCGAWGCFDEFNRLKEDQLSAVSQQIQIIQAAIKEKSPSIHLLGKSVSVNANAGIFVTMNPAGKDYGGRSKLPDNLKQLFRPVAMSKPDNQLIAEVILSSEGFKWASDLGQKMVSLYKLSKDLLSTQQHYDWGLRAMKAVLNTAGALVQQCKGDPEFVCTEEKETEVLIKAIRVNTLSKLTYDDSKAFLGLVNDIFPDVPSVDIQYEELEEAMKQVMESSGLQATETQLRKMMQLKEALDQRMGCVIVGPSGCGKTTLWKVLRESLMKLGTEVKVYVMNPKSMPRERLLGNMDLDTREWTDGVLTDAARKMVRENENTRSWVVCDGDVDPEWIESLNSVLDDNKLLTLPNGERISFGKNVNFLFETHDLRFASPATISRMGMIFLSEEDVDVSRLITSWLDKQPEEARQDLEEWMSLYFCKALDWLLRNDQFVVSTTKVGIVQDGLSQLCGTTTRTRADFLVGLIRGLGSNLDAENRKAFAKECTALMDEALPTSSALDCYVERGRYAAYEAETEVEGEFDPCSLGDSASMAILRTKSVKQHLDMIAPWVERMEPFILVGPEGAGKTMLLRYCFDQEARSTSVATLHCNAQTSASHVVQKLHQTCALFSTNVGRVFRPRESERLVLFLKDINLPKPDEYNTCMLIEFLNQLITCHGFYDDSLEFIGLERVQIVASMNPASTVGRHPLSTRFTANVHIGYIGRPHQDELTAVYTAILQHTVQENKLLVPTGKWQERSTLRKLARTMIDIYLEVQSSFSVDDHRHYLLTTRHITRWVRGLLRYDTMNEELLDVVAYEAFRVFQDRLVDEDDESKFAQNLQHVMRKDWSYKVDFSSTYFVPTERRSEDEEKQEEGADSNVPSSTKSVLMRSSTSDFQESVEHGLMMYEREEEEINLKIFPQVLEHIASVLHMLSADGASMLLVGLSGVGRRTSIRLSAHMLGYQFLTPRIVGVGDDEAANKMFVTDLKRAMTVAGVEGQPVVLYVEDHQLVTNRVLESLNSLVSSGEVPGLYKNEELVPMLEPIKEKMQEQADLHSCRSPYEFFHREVQRNLHVVLSMDPTDEFFQLNCEANPALYTACSILWLGDWRPASIRAFPMLYVPERFEEDNDDLLEACIAIHEGCRENGATPRDLITFLESFKELYASKAGRMEKRVEQFLGGLSKLNDAAETVDSLKEEASVQRVELKRKQTLADESMEKITEALAEASSTRTETEKLKEEMTEAERETLTRKEGIEEELSEIKPILDKAKRAVGKIKAEHLTELRSFKMPPEPVADVLSGVLMLLGINDVSWVSMKRFLGNRGVKEEILEYNPERITEDIFDRVSNLLRKKRNSFEPTVIAKSSAAAAPFADWVKANLKYSLVLKKLKPLQAELDEATEQLEGAQKRLREYEEKLEELDTEVLELQSNFKQLTRDAEELKIRVQDKEETLQKAEKLIGQLSGERERWQVESKSLTSVMESLPMRILLAAAFLTYLGATTEDIRKRCVEDWASWLYQEDDASEEKEGKEAKESDRLAFDLKALLSSESTMLSWKADGLPGDDLSMENAIIILQGPSRRCPFIVDPASAATEWLKQSFANDDSRPAEIVAQQDPRFINKVELAVRFGKTLIVTECDRVEPMLIPLIRKDLKREGPRFVVSIGDKEIDYNENFRLFLVTRNANPTLPPCAKSLVTEVNFTVTRSGLKGQLLGVTVKHEKPLLEDEKSRLLKQEEEYKIQLAQLEAELLDALAESQGNLLENQALLDTLSKSKEKSAQVSAALQESAVASEKLDLERNQYEPFAAKGADLYFSISALQSVNHMYQFSIQSFRKVFRRTLSSVQEDDSIQEKIRQLCSVLEKNMLFFVGRSLFKKDRLMFAVHLIHEMKPEVFKDNEWEYFVGQATSETDSSTSLPSWAVPDRELQFGLFQSALPELVTRCRLNEDQTWRRWGQANECEKAFPAAVEMTAFQQVLLVQTLRPDRLQSCMLQFVLDILGIDSITPSQGLESCLQEMDCATPVLMITTVGADPSEELRGLAEQKLRSMDSEYKELAMGGGQAEEALALLREMSRKGGWLVLKNLHLVGQWIPRLEKEFNGLNAHEDFRLWLTTEESNTFAPILLQQCLKITFESPPGIKQNMLRTVSSWPDELIQNHDDKGLLFLLAWFHALVQERRTFIPQGWSKFYEFSLGDLRSGVGVLELVANSLADGGGDQTEADWEYIHGLMENSVYGGRIDNFYDLRVLRAYLKLLFNSNMKPGSLLTDNSVALRLPDCRSKEEMLRWISKLEDVDDPLIFGLPRNIDRSVQRAQSEDTLQALKSLSRKSIQDTSFDRKKWTAALRPVMEQWQALCQDAKILQCGKDHRRSRQSVGEDPSPVQLAILNEEAKANRLVNQIDTTLKELRQVLKGAMLLTPHLQSIAIQLMQDQVPSGWARIWEGPNEPQAWMRCVARRKLAVQEWSNIPLKSLVSRPIDLAELFNPGTFINAVRQETARALRCPLDNLHMVSVWVDADDRTLQDSPWKITVTNLLLQGALFSGNDVALPDEHSPELVKVSDCMVAFLPKEEEKPYDVDDTVALPLYCDTRRERLLLELDIPCKGDPNKVIMSSAALFLKG